MSDRKNLCVLVAEVIGGDRLVARLGKDEATHAVDRCLNRIDRAIGGNGGETLERNGSRITASFERCDAGVVAACEMLERVLNLPPVSGSQLKIRIGLHYGLTQTDEDGEGIEGARRLVETCQPGQALASNTAVMLLSPATRHFAAAEAFQSEAQRSLEWPVFAIGHRVGMVTSVPPNARISQRLRLRHQEDVVFVEENRPIVLIGRELGNDVVIIDARASRQHARIERRREGFVLIDQSSNGCHVSINGDPERCIKDDELVLSGSGRIGCGFSSNEIERDLVFFDLV
ncbi:FHA domain-containing protein [Azoarcus sp. L1K30]|uniref:FHA domain-containing protein n=1 Tax=Azoarcus sp. L1K30 TaxID=2820277 RepID=UPI001B831B88|nr:FHA domain-containing protein [Azoarcus sp. L1K30]MBR0566466.1 FHA domain-containing protein [Azoarcus sp. L1K30]